jgi:hypothetical protein
MPGNESQARELTAPGLRQALPVNTGSALGAAVRLPEFARAQGRG